MDNLISTPVLHNGFQATNMNIYYKHVAYKLKNTIIKDKLKIYIKL